MAKRTLRLTTGPGAGLEIEIEDEIVLGRENADVTIEDAELSRRHVALRPAERGVEVEDLGSLNGTFVDGRRLAEPEVVTTTAKLKLGNSEGTLELALADVTRAAPIPDPDVTLERPLADPDVTVQRSIPDPDVTAQRPIADPDVTAQRPLPDPDVTAQRPIADPDVTKQRAVPGPAVTAQRPQAPAEPGGGGPPVPLIAGAIGAVVLVIVLIVLLTGGSDEGATERKVDVRYELHAPTAGDKRRSEMAPGDEPVHWTLVGTASGDPFGDGGKAKTSVTLQPIPKPPPGVAPPPAPPGGRAASVSVHFEVTYPNGTIIAAETLKSRKVGGGLDIKGTGQIIDGTGDFENATGSFKVDAERPDFHKSFERAHWTGSVSY